MKYVGSKARFAKQIVPIMLKNHMNGGAWIEPFVGGGNVICEVPSSIPRFGDDIDGGVIRLLKAVASGWEPFSEVTDEVYFLAKTRPEFFAPEFVTFIAHCCSFGGKKWGGFARGTDSKGKPRNYADEQCRHLLKMAPKIQNVIFEINDYYSMTYAPNATIYCDPPYEGVTGYGDSFNTADFWDWVSETYKDVGQMFVSEYHCPLDNATVVWEAETKTMLSKTGSKKAVEKLFKIG
jgi:DNA adenine methylase